MQRHKGVQPSTLTLTLTSGSVINVGKIMHLTKAHLKQPLSDGWPWSGAPARPAHEWSWFTIIDWEGNRLEVESLPGRVDEDVELLTAHMNDYHTAHSTQQTVVVDDTISEDGGGESEQVYE